VKRSLPRGGAGWSVLAAVVVCFGLSSCTPEPAAPPPPPAGAIPAGQPIGSGAIVGHVSLEGTPPPRRPIRMSDAACHRPGSEALTEEVVVSPQGGLKNVYVHVVSGLGDRVFAPPATAAEVDQAGCTFVPHVLDVQANQIVAFGNSDPIVHNVRAIAEKNRPFNVSMPGKGKPVRRFFSSPETVRIRCDIHAWMSGVVAVESHPFHAVTGEDGSFELKGLPAGDYTVEAWQEKLGAKTGRVHVDEGGKATLDFTFGAVAP